MNKKNGFTLAELLISLGVIGVIVAIVLPTINSLMPNQEMIMLKKTYYLVGRTVNELINDEDLYPDTDVSSKSGFSNTTAITYHNKSYSGDEKFCELFANKLNVKGDINCTSTRNKSNAFVAGSEPKNAHFTTADGVAWILPINDFSGANDGRQSIYVDVNGDDGGNCFEAESNCKRPDRFEIKIDRYGKIFVDDDLTKAYLSASNTTKSYEDIKKDMKKTSSTETEPETD